ncbi:MAG: SET domain-containing protein [Ferruginibacter sp.]
MTYLHFMNRKQLLEELTNNTWCMLKPSLLHGIGVFAARDIPQGCREMFSKGIGKWLAVSRTEVDHLPEHSKALIENFCLYDTDNYFIPDYGFKLMDLAVFINHSEAPNIISIDDGEEFETTRMIKAGEELLINYGEIVESEE